MLATKPRKPSKRVIRVGPADHGKRMSLDDFDRAIVVEGYFYELAKGVIEVSEVPASEHGAQVFEINRQLFRYEAVNEGKITRISSGQDMKLLVAEAESERHPDIAVYTTSEPDIAGRAVWSVWVPTLVFEIVSESSRKRDYEEKPQEYLELGVDEYWIVDATKKLLVQHVRVRGKWETSTVRPPKKVTSVHVPGFKLDLAKVIAASKK